MNLIPDTLPPFDLLHGASLFLDFDGTLVDISPTPDAVVVSERLRGLLARLQARLNGRVAILSGRSSSDIAGLVEPVPILVGGSHGLELPGEQPNVRPEALDAIIGEFRLLESRHPGVLVEEKPLGVALHYRQAPAAEAACRTAAEQAAERSGLEVQPGKMVFELKPRGGDKGAALRALMSREPFAGSRPVFLGDDLTDEPGFVAAGELGGAGVLIGPPRATGAAYRITGVAEAIEWLSRASEGGE